MDSSFKLDYSLRASPDPIHSIIRSSNQEIFWTLDKHCIRIWSVRKQLKSKHFLKELIENRKIIFVEHVPHIDCCMVVFTSKSSIDPVSTIIQLWSISLKVVQQHEFNSLPIKIFKMKLTKAHILPEHKTTETMASMVAIDKNNIPILFKFYISTKSKIKDEPKFIRDVDKLKKSFQESMSNTVTKITMKVYERQRFPQIKEILEEGYQIKDCIIMDNDSFIMIDNNQNLIIGARKPLEVPDFGTAEISMKPNKAPLLEKDYSICKIINLSDIIEDSSSVPCILQYMNETNLIVGFNDGWIRIITCDFYVKERNVSEWNPNISLSFHAHNSPKNVGVTCIRQCIWTKNPKSMYSCELFTAGEDMRVCHWGMYTVSSIDLLEQGSLELSAFSSLDDSSNVEGTILINDNVIWKIELLGDYNFGFEPFSHISSDEKRQEKFYPKNLINFELSCFQYPCRKMFLCTSAGMIANYVVYHSSRKIFDARSKASSVCPRQGPLMQEFSNVPTLASIDVTEQSITGSKRACLMLRDEVLEIYDPKSGDQIQHYQTIGKVLNGEKYVDAKAATIYWCSITKQIVVGYVTGEIRFIQTLIRQPPKKLCRDYIDSRGVHGTSIRSITTFRSKPSPLDPEQVFMVLGDDSGVLSTWLIFPLPKNSSAILLWSSQVHRGSIFYANVFAYKSSNEFKNRKIVITADRSGLIKSWTIDANGTLRMTSYIQTLQSGLSAVCPVPFCSSEFKSDVEHCTLVVLCGFQLGTIEVWVISEDSMKCLPKPHVMFKDTTSEITCIASCSTLYNALKNQDFEQVFSRDSYAEDILCTCIDGTTFQFRVQESGVVDQTGYFTLPYAVNYIYASSEFADKQDSSHIEFIVMGESTASEILVTSADLANYTSKYQAKYVVQKDYSLKSSTKSRVVGIDDEGINDEDDEHVLNQNEIDNDEDLELMEDNAAPTESYDNLTSIEKDDSEKSKEQSEEIKYSATDIIPVSSEKKVVNLIGIYDPSVEEVAEEKAIEPSMIELKDDDSIDDTNLSVKDIEKYEHEDKQGRLMYHENMYPVELELAKKDKFLLDAFRQNIDTVSHTLSFEISCVVLHKWVGEDFIEEKDVENLLHEVLGSKNRNVSFLNVAKTAARLSLMKKEGSPVFPGKFFDYKQMRLTETKTEYNNLGEKIINKVAVPDGKVKGYNEKLRSVWNKQSARVNSKPDDDFHKYPKTLMRAVPKALRTYIKLKVQHPTRWAPTNEHWLDLRRTMRIGRILLDMRSSKQYAAYLAHLSDNSIPLAAESFTRILVSYFETNFGGFSGMLQVAHLKVVNFIEACLQYSEYPLINFLRRNFCPESSSEVVDQVSLWLYVEARNLLVSRKQIIQGDLIPALHSSFNLSLDSYLTNAASAAVPNAVNWLLVTRVDALNCVDEMIRDRGRYGPAVTKHMLGIIDNIPTVNRNGSGDYVDLELFLEVLVTEFNLTKKHIQELENVAFCSNPLFNEPNQVICLKQIINNMVEFDAQRRGIIDMETFRAVLYKFQANNPNFAIERLKVEELYELCLHNYKDESANGKICYVDFWVIVLAWMEQTGCSEAFTCINLMEAINSVQKGVEENVASTVVILLSHIQAPYSVGPAWTCARIVDDKNQNKTLLAQKGMWNVNTSVDFISEGPGQLIAKHIDAELTSAPSLFEKSIENLEQKSVEYSSPMILSTNRMLTTVYGEICKPVPMGKTKAAIHFNDLSKQFQQSAELMPLEDKSDSMHSMTSTILDPSMPPKYFSKSLASIDSKSMKRSVSERQTTMHTDLSISEDFSKDFSNVKFSAPDLNSLYPSLLKSGTPMDSLAQRIAEKMKMEILRKELDVAQKQQQEMITVGSRIQKKKIIEKRNRKLAWKKYNESMAQKEIYDQQRDEHIANRNAMLEKRAKQIEADRMAASMGERDKILRQKAEQLRIKNERADKEAAEKQKVRELEEQLAMKKEEQRSKEYEDFIAEQARKAEERRLKKEAEEQERLRQEREAARLAEEQRLKEEAEALAEFEKQSRNRERKLMKENDINAIVVEEIIPVEMIVDSDGISRPKTALEAEQSQIENSTIQEPEGDAEEAESVAETIKKESEVDKKINLFLSRVANSVEENSSHPRRNVDHGEFFIPLMFNDDIVFHAFDSQPSASKDDYFHQKHEKLYKHSKKNDTDSRPNSRAQPLNDDPNLELSYKDIGKSVVAHKRLLADIRKMQLFKTSDNNLPASEWTTMYKTDYVDWKTFFYDEKKRHLEDSPSPEKPPNPERVFLDEMQNLAESKASEVSVISNDINRLQRRLDINPADTNVTPLPLGNVLEAVAYCNEFVYYQIEIVDKYSIVTIELQSVYGHADLYVSKGDYLPTLTNFIARRLFIKDANQSRLSRLTLELGYAGTVFIGVHSTEGAKFNLWAFCSNKITEESEPIANTSKVLRGFNILSSSSVDNLQLNFPKLYQVARSIAESEASVVKKTIYSEMNEFNESGQNEDNEFYNSETFEDVLTMDSFLSKQGRSILRNQSLSVTKGSLDETSDEYEELEDYMKYAHPDLFFKPKKLDDNEKELIEITQPMTPTSDERSLKTTSLLIASRYLPSLNKELNQMTASFKQPKESGQLHLPNIHSPIKKNNLMKELKTIKYKIRDTHNKGLI